MLTFQEIESHINRPPDKLMKELSTLREDHCRAIDRLKKSYPIRKWILDRAKLLGNASESLSYGQILITIHDASIEDVIEHLAGPIHRRFNCFWRLSYDVSIDLHSIKSIPIEGSNYKFNVKIYIYSSTDCELKTFTRKVWKEETTYQMNCQPEV